MCAGVAVRLKREHDPPTRIPLTQGLQRSRDLRRVVAVIVNDGDAARSGVDIADVLQPAIDSLKAGKCALNRAVLDPDFAGDDDGGKRIQNVVSSRQVDCDPQWHTRGPYNIIGGLQTLATDVHSSNISIGRSN